MCIIPSGTAVPIKTTKHILKIAKDAGGPCDEEVQL